MEEACLLSSRTLRHSEPDMSKTYAEMVKDMSLNRLFNEKKGRSTVQQIIDGFAEGHSVINNKGWVTLDAENLDSETPVYYDDDDQDDCLAC